MTTIVPGDGDPRHGSTNGYGNLGCRCADCRAAHLAYTLKRQAERLESDLPATVVHGTVSTYNNWGCRCLACTQAQSASSLAKYHRRRRARESAR